MRHLNYAGGKPLWAIILLPTWLTLSNTASAATNYLVVWGNSAVTNVPAHVTNVAMVATSGYGCVAVGRDGHVAGWGTLGRGLPPAATNGAAVAMQSSPVVRRRDGSVVYQNGPVPGISNAVAVAAGWSYGAGALQADGVFMKWDGLWTPASGTSNVVAIAGGGYASIDLLFTDGTVFPTEGFSGISNVVAIARQNNMRVCLRSDGAVASYPMTAPADLSNVVAIAAGNQHGLALKQDGTVVAWGDNTVGQTNVPAGLSGVVAMAAGASHSLALKADGTVVAWGRNGSPESTVPAGLTNVAAVFAGGMSSVAMVGASPPALLTEPPDEAVWSDLPATFTVSAVGSAPLRYQWQFNGERIEGATNAFYRIERATAAHDGFYNVLISNPHGSVASRSAHLGVRLHPGFLQHPTNQVSLFGGSTTFRVTVKSAAPVSYQWFFKGRALAGATQANLEVSDLAPGNAGSYWCVASNMYGLTTSAVARLEVTLPVGPTNQVSWLGGSVVFTATNGGSQPITYQWYSPAGPLAGATQRSLTLNQVGLGQAGDYWVVASSRFGSCTSAAVQLAINGLALWGRSYSALPTNLPAIAAMGAGEYHAFARRSDGTPVLWGNNYGGKADVPACCSNLVALTGGEDYSLGLLANGTVLVWGSTWHGAVENIPAGLSNIVAVVTGNFRCLALGADGHVWGWGEKADGVNSVPNGLDQVVSIAARGLHSLALRADGTVVAWGDDTYGQIRVPPGLSNAVAIAAGDRHSLALRADGTVVAWGDNTFGQTSVPANGSNVIAIAAGFYHNLALREDGTVVAWGDNSYGQTDVPPSLSNVVAIAAGGYFNLAMVEAGLAASPVRTLNPACSNGVFALRVPTSRGRSYQLQYREALAGSRWTPLPPVPGDDTTKTLVDKAATPAQRFYRVGQKL